MDKTIWSGGPVSRRSVLAGLGAAMTAGVLPRRAPAQPAPPATGTASNPQKKPNILFLFSDDQRFDTIAALGNDQVKTPALDGLVARGMTFTHHYIQGGPHGAICVASRAILMTGQTVWHAMASVEKAPLLPQLLAGAGYETFMTGKWHNGGPACCRAFQKGKAIFLGGMADHLKTPVQDLDGSGGFANKRTENRYSSQQFADAVIEFIQARKDAPADKPFFAYVAFTAPHDPRMAPQEFRDLYPVDKIKLPPNFLPEHPFDNGELKVRDEKLAGFPRTQDEVRRHLADYYAIISHMDSQIARILQALRQAGLEDNTIIVFNGDNGLAVGRHGLMGKQNLYDHSMRTPLILAGPGIPAGKRCDALVCQHDLLPTLCGLAGASVPPSVEGTSIQPLIAGQAASVHDSVFAAYRDCQRMVRAGAYKLIDYPQAKRTQLFDLAADPDEMKDLSASSEQAQRLADLRAKMLDYQKRLDDPLLKPKPAGPAAGTGKGKAKKGAAGADK